MNKLEDIPKKTLFEVPEGYFDRLPGIIQARVAEKRPEVAWGSFAVKFALPAVALVAAGLFFWSGPTAMSTEDMLAGIDSEQLVAYLGESELNADDLLESVPLDQDEASALEDDALNEIELSDIDLEELEQEFDSTNEVNRK